MDIKEHYPNQFARADVFQVTDDELATCAFVNNRSIEWMVSNQRRLRGLALGATMTVTLAITLSSVRAKRP